MASPTTELNGRSGDTQETQKEFERVLKLFSGKPNKNINELTREDILVAASQLYTNMIINEEARVQAFRALDEIYSPRGNEVKFSDR